MDTGGLIARRTCSGPEKRADAEPPGSIVLQLSASGHRPGGNVATPAAGKVLSDLIETQGAKVGGCRLNWFPHRGFCPSRKFEDENMFCLALVKLGFVMRNMQV
jgi:hypothetical protein